MNSLDVKNYLNQVRINDARVEILIKEKEELELRFEQILDNSRYKDILRQIQHKEDEINQAIDEYINYREEVAKRILKLDNALYMKILAKRYFEYKTFETIASEIYVSVRHTTRLHGYALLAMARSMTDDGA